jgi:hypothetical protein
MRLGAPAIAAGAALAADTASAQPAAGHLTLIAVLADAAPPVQAIIAGLVLAMAGAVALWFASLPKVGSGQARALASALGRLRMLRTAGAPVGALAGSYSLLMLFIGVANVRPGPSFEQLAPGFAEAVLALMVGLCATSLAAVLERHLETRIRCAAL